MSTDKGIFVVVEKIKKAEGEGSNIYSDPFEGLSDQERAYQLGYREGQKTAYHLVIDSCLELLSDVKDVS